MKKEKRRKTGVNDCEQAITVCQCLRLPSVKKAVFCVFWNEFRFYFVTRFYRRKTRKNNGCIWLIMTLLVCIFHC